MLVDFEGSTTNNTQNGTPLSNIYNTVSSTLLTRYYKRHTTFTRKSNYRTYQYQSVLKIGGT
jgi:hypothetical protein